MRIIIECLRPSPTDYWPILAGIQPAELRRQGSTLFLACRNLMNPKHPLHQLMSGPITVHEERLLSQHLFVPVARKMLNELSKLSIRTAQWIDYKWDGKYFEDQSELRLFFPRPSARPLRMDLPRPAYARLNRFGTGVGRF